MLFLTKNKILSERFLTKDIFCSKNLWILYFTYEYFDTYKGEENFDRFFDLKS